MFEQELYNNEATQVESQDGDLFHNYEIRNWNYSTALYKILAISAVLNLAVLAFIGQTNLLTLRGCDSPFVGRVCQVLDMAYVGTVLFGTEREYVDMEYEKTDLGDAEITYIDVSGETPPLSYPEGYFQIANPVQHAMRQQMLANPTNAAGMPTPRFPMTSSFPNSDSDLLKSPPKPPVANPNAFQDDGATTTLKAGGNGANAVTRKRNRGGKVTVTPTDDDTKDPKDDTVAAVKTSPTPTPPANTTTDPITGDEINNRPFSDLGKLVSDKVDKNEVNLQTEFTLNAKGKLTKEGKLDPKTFRYLKAESTDKKLIEIVQEAIEAFNDSGRLKVLEKLSGKDLDLLVQQDGVNISAVVKSELESENRARSMQSSLGILLAAAKQLKSGADASPNDKDDLVLLEGAKIENDGKNLVIRFIVPKEIIHQMIQRKLAQQKLENKKPSGNAVISPTNNSAKK
jgi:hypothetical protein